MATETNKISYTIFNIAVFNKHLVTYKDRKIIGGAKIYLRVINFFFFLEIITSAQNYKLNSIEREIYF